MQQIIGLHHGAQFFDRALAVDEDQHPADAGPQPSVAMFDFVDALAGLCKYNFHRVLASS
ncbi:MAG: hypothetical protein LWW92_05770 [Rhodocyclales bacterium]|nr:hypothetical protein [Rhodocyclales bacterium]